MFYIRKLELYDTLHHIHWQTIFAKNAQKFCKHNLTLHSCVLHIFIGCVPNNTQSLPRMATFQKILIVLIRSDYVPKNTQS